MPGRSVEDAIQAEVVRTARHAGLMVYHVPNGGQRSAREGTALKRIGVLAGVPDLVFVLPEGRHVYVEMKTMKGKTSEAQEGVMKRLEELGNQVFVAHGLAEGLKIVEALEAMAAGGTRA